jgi:glycosyltransferase involved in cell wall biosynthesis
MSTIGLAMIVRDGGPIFRRCLESAKPFIDTWTIIDTGSIDGTPAVVGEILGELPGTLKHSEWVGFGHNRSELMALAKGTADYLLLLDADMILHYEGDQLPELTSDVYNGTIRSSMNYELPLLVKGDRNWRYEGVAHSYLASDRGWDGETLQGLWIEDHSHTTVEKLRRDLDLLAAEHARNPLDARTAFYLAQTYYDLDMFPEAIAMYRYRANLDGWDEENFFARYRLGVLLGEHVDFLESARELLAAWQMRPSRVEPLRVLANLANSVADKYPLSNDKLFVVARHYKQLDPPAVLVQPEVLPPLPSLKAKRVRLRAKKLRIKDIAAVLVTRGNVDMEPILATLPYDEIVIWDNSKRDHDLKVMGRYAAIPETTKPVIYWQDDDVVFTEHDRLLAAYTPGMLVANMDEAWIDGAGYRSLVAMQGAGSLCDRDLPERVFARYFAEYPWDEEARTEGDFIFGVLAPSKVIDIGYETLPYTDDPDRLYTQPGQTERKWRMIERCRELRDRDQAAA